MSSFDALIIALADGRSLRDAALGARMTSATAVREARAVGWPDMDAIRAAATEIRERHATTTTDDDLCDHCASPSDRCGDLWPDGRRCCPDCTHPDLPGGDPVPSRTQRDPIPVEPDVEAAMTRGARQAEQARGALATSAAARNAHADEVLNQGARKLDERTTRTGSSSTNPVRVTLTPEPPEITSLRVSTTPDGPVVEIPVEPEGQPQPAAEATDEPRRPDDPAIQVMPEDTDAQVLAKMHAEQDAYMRMLSDRAKAQAGLTAAERSRAARTLGVDAALIEDTAATPQILERIGGALDREQEQRAYALREVAGIYAEANVGEILALADYIITGVVPALLVTGSAR